MGLRDRVKRKMPATFNAAEYETDRILNRLDQYAGRVEDTTQELESIQGKIDRQLEELESVQGKIGRQSEALESVQGEINRQSETLESVREEINRQSEMLESLQKKTSWQSELLEGFREALDRQSDAWMDVQQKLDHCTGQSDETAQILKSALEQLDSLSRRLIHLEGDLHWRVERMEKAGVRHTPWPVLSFEVALAEHCNLKCAGCDHFSPVAEPEFADIKEFTRDFERLSELFSGRAREIHLLGGEPLLHPDLASFLKTARRCFPQAVIDITTNGVLLPRMGEIFWDTCHKERIVIRPTKYPEESIDYDAAEKLAAQYGVEYRYIDNTDQTAKTLTKYPLDLKGLQDPRRSFMLCHRANACIYLQHGRLYTCTVAPTIRHLNSHFGTRFEEAPEDSIDIYQVSSADEILDYLAHPIPFCRYCMPERAQEGQPWRRSKKELTEWI